MDWERIYSPAETYVPGYSIAEDLYKSQHGRADTALPVLETHLG